MPTRFVVLAFLLTACTAAPPPAPTPTGHVWSAEEQTAITEATTQYGKSRAAYDAALQNPATATRATLEAAGNSGTWLDDAVSRTEYLRAQKTRRTGAVKIVSTTPTWVDVTAPTPAVILKTCLDYTAIAGHTVTRRLIDARLLRLPTGWSLTNESENPDNASPTTPNHPIC